MPKITFNYYGGKKIGLLIVGIFAISGLVLSFLIPKVIYPAESNSAYTSHVQFLLPILEAIFFVIGITLSIKVRKGSNPKILESNSKHYSTVNIRDISDNQNMNMHDTDKIQFLESRIEHYRKLSETDPSELPELAKRLVTLSLLYKEIDEEKSKEYLKEAKSVVGQENYPNDEKGKEVSNFVNRITN